MKTQIDRLSPARVARLLVLSLVFVCTVSADPEYADGELVPGTLGGSLMVDAGGAANYSIPIQVSPGTAGLAPSIAFDYSSQQGVGVLGRGWSISGLSSITRGRKNLQDDGIVQGVTLSDRDALFLDGQKLVLINESGGKREYRTQVNNHSKIISEINTDGDRVFTVRTKAGLRMEYRQPIKLASGEALLWLCTRILDTLSNYIEFEYWVDTGGEHAVKKISYTGNVKAGMQPYAALEFEYVALPQNSKTVRFLLGNEIRSTRVLGRVDSVFGIDSGDRRLFRSYQLSYRASSSPSKEYLLESVRESGETGDYHRPTKFSYADAFDLGRPVGSRWRRETDLSFPDSAIASKGRRATAYSLVDVNRDGFKDLLYSEDVNGALNSTVLLGGRRQWSFPEGENYKLPFALLSPEGRDWRLIDIDTSGRKAYLRSGTASSKAELYILEDKTWVSKPEYTDLPELSSSTMDGLHFIDVNDDGAKDVLIRRRDVTEGFSAYTFGANGWVPAPEFYLAYEKVTVQDINCDGTEDLLAWEYEPLQRTLSIKSLIVDEGWQQDENLPDIKVDGVVDGSFFAQQADLDGDGCEDLLLTVRDEVSQASYIYSATKAGLVIEQGLSDSFPDVISSTGGSLLFARLNSDAYLDLIVASDTGSVTYSQQLAYDGDASRTWVPVPVNSDPLALNLNGYTENNLIDVDKDGIDEVLRFYTMDDAFDPKIAQLSGGNWFDLVDRKIPVTIAKFDKADSGAQFIDLNGDGLEDLVTADKSYRNTTTGWRPFNNDGFKPPVRIALENGGDSGIRIIDINGDGLVDFLYAYRDKISGKAVRGIYLNDRGLTWKAAPSNSKYLSSFNNKDVLFTAEAEGPTGTQLVDLNGDGLVDILHSHSTSVYQNSAYALVNKGPLQGWIEQPDYSVCKDPTRGSCIQLSFRAKKRYASNPRNNSIPNLQNYSTGSQIIDLNGDSLPDILYSYRFAELEWTQQGIDYAKGEWRRLRGGQPFPSELGDAKPGEINKYEDCYEIDLLDCKSTDSSRKRRNIVVKTGALINTGRGWRLQTQFFPTDMPRLDGDYENNQQLESKNHILTPNVVDHNGDGLLDLHFLERRWDTSGHLKMSYTVFVNTGEGFRKDVAGNWSLLSELSSDNNIYDFGIRYMDINGDGRVDVLKALQNEDGKSGDYKAYTNNGSKWVKDASYKPTLPLARNKRGDQGVRLVDVNGDGLLDFLQNFMDTEAGKDKPKNQVYYNVGGSAPLLSQVEDGLGNVTLIQYQTMSYASPGTEKTYVPERVGSEWPEIHAIPPSHLVQRVGVSIPGYSSDTGQRFNFTSYQYGGFRVNAKTSRPMGFRWREDWNLTSGVRNRTEYYQSCNVEDLASCYLVGKEKTFSSSGLVEGEYRKLVERRTDYQLEKGSANNRGLPVFSMKRVDGLELKYNDRGDHLGCKAQTIVYGGRENQYIEKTVTRISAPSDTSHPPLCNQSEYEETVTKNEYLDHELPEFYSKWFLARLSSSKVTKSFHGAGPYSTGEESRSSCFTYNPDNGLLQSQAENCGHEKQVTSRYVYDQFGNKIRTETRARDVEPRIQIVSYDPHGRLPVKTTNAAGHIFEVLEYDASKGIPTRTSDENALQSSMRLDDFGNLTESVDPTGVVSQISFSFVESSHSCATNRIACFSKIEKVGSLPPIKTIYDSAGREIESISQGFVGVKGSREVHGASRRVSQKTDYGFNGRLLRRSIPTFVSQDSEGGANPLITDLRNHFRHTGDSCAAAYASSHHSGGRESARALESRWVHYFYDDLGRERATLLPDGGLLCTDFGLMSQTSYDQRSNPTVTHFDFLQRPLVVSDALGGKTLYQYDQGGRIKAVVNANGQLIRYGYNGLGEKVSTYDPDVGLWHYQYDSFGQLIKQQDAEQRITYLHYDTLGRLVKKEHEDAVLVWRYDESLNGVGRLASVNDDHGYIEEYTYDRFTRQIITETTAKNRHFTQRTEYDEFSRVQRVISPTGYVQENVYDVSGYLASVNGAQRDSDFDTLWKAEDYDAAGRVIVESVGSGVRTLSHFNQHSGQLTETCTFGPSRDIQSCNSSGATIQKHQYEYDLASNLVEKVDFASGRSVAHQFDELNRLVEVHHQDKSTVDYFEYDATGNFTFRSDLGRYSYANQNGGSANRLDNIVKIDGSRLDFDYDGIGNTVRSHRGVFSYNSRNLVTEIRKDRRNKSSFDYTPDGQRYFQEYRHDRRLIKTTYLGNYERIYEIGAEPLLPTSERIRHRHYVLGATGVVGVVEEIDWLYPVFHGQSFERATGFQLPGHTANLTLKVSFFLKDSLGSVTAVVNHEGEVWDRFEYDAWGKRVEIGRSDHNTYRLGYTGHEHLDNLGLVHMNGRVYDPEVGRFVSADEFIQSPSSSQSYSRYSYVGNNPYKYVDPSGFLRIKIGNPFKKLRNAFNRIKKGIENSIKKVGKWLEENWREVVTVVVVVAVSYACAGTCTSVVAGALAGFAGGATGAALYGGDIHDVLSAGTKGAAFGAFTAGMAEAWGGVNGIAEGFGSGFDEGTIGRALGHGVSGGLTSEMQGGDFMHGFGSASFTHYASAAANVNGIEGFQGEEAARVSVDAAIGGTASVIGGGKFANGAVTAAFQSQFNREAHRKQDLDAREQLEYDLAMQAMAEDQALESVYPEFLLIPAARAAKSVGRFGKLGWSSAKRFLGPKGPVFGNTYYRGKGNAGLLNYRKVRLGWSYNKATGRANFSLRVGKFHSDKYFNPISMKAPPKAP